MRRVFTVVGIGELLWDLLPGGRQPGGAPANFVCHAAALGARGCLVSCVGADAAGRELAAWLAARGLTRRWLALDRRHPTGAAAVRVDAAGRPVFRLRPRAAWDFIPWSAALRALARRADAVACGSLAQRSPRSRRTIRRFLAATRPDCLRLLDVNLRQQFFSRDVIQGTLARSNALKLSDAELPVVSRLLGLRGRPAEILRALVARYRLRLAVLTRGPRGSLLADAEGIHAHPGVRARVVDTVGAGDAFNAGLVLGLLTHGDPECAQDAANRLAAYVCSRPGATPALPAGLARRLTR